MLEECKGNLHLISEVEKCFISGSSLKFVDWELENCGEEVSESLYKEYVSKLNSCSEPEDYHYRHFRITNQTLTIRENISFVSGGTTGLATWEGGLALAEWCIRNSSVLCARRVLELGCGLGLAGLSVSLACRPRSFTFTDHHPSVLQAVEHNIQLNQQLLDTTLVKTELLDWEDIGNYLNTEVDVVLAADVVFDERLFPALVNTLCHFLNNKTTSAVLACTERNSLTLSTFLANLAKRNIRADELECPKPETFLYSLSPPIRFFRCKHAKTQRK